MSEYLVKPERRRGALMVKGDPHREDEARPSHVTEPAPSNAAIPYKTAEMKAVEVPSEKVLEAKRRKQEAAARLGLKSKGVGAGGSKGAPSSGKRPAGEGVSSRTSKKAKTNADTPIIELDSSEHVPAPQPLRSVHPDGSMRPPDGEEGASSQFGAGDDGSPLRSYGRGKDKKYMEGIDETDKDEPTSGEIFVPGWSVRTNGRLNGSSVCRDMMTHLPTPCEEEYLESLSDDDVVRRAWMLLGKNVVAQSDLLIRFETLLGDYHNLSVAHEKCSGQDPEELGKLKTEHADCGVTIQSLTDRVSELVKEKEGQGEILKSLEAELAKTKYLLADEQRDNRDLRKEREDLAVRLGNTEIERFRVVKEFLPDMVRRFLSSHEYKQSLALPFNLSSMAGFVDGVAVDRTPEETVEILADFDNVNVDAGKKYNSLFDQLFVTEYPYVEKVRKACYKSLQEIMELYPDPAPAKPAGPPIADGSIAPNVASGAIDVSVSGKEVVVQGHVITNVEENVGENIEENVGGNFEENVEGNPAS